MIQKYYTHNPYQIPSSPINQQQHIKKATSPKLQSSKSSRFKSNNNKSEYNKNTYIPTYQTYNHQQSSQSYSSYYANKPINPNSFSQPSSYPSKHSRTQNSKEKLYLISQNNQQKQYQLKMQQKYQNYPENSISQSQQRTNNLLSHLKNNQKFISKQSTSRHNRHLKTQTSKTKIHQYETSQTKTKQNLKLSNHSDKKSQISSSNINNLQNNPSKTLTNSYSPFHEYYANKQQQKNYTETPIQMSRRFPNHRRINSGSRDTSTINTQNRPSSLSLNKFNKKPMLTFYHCQLKKFYNYNDQGYLTNKQYLLRQKIQQKAMQTFDRAIQSQPTLSKTRKSKSLAQFPRMNSLKQQAQKQRKRNQQIYGKFQEVKQKYYTDTKIKQTLQLPTEKPYSPSQLPPTSTLSKRKFNIIYKEDQNQNLLGKLSINDDSYHEREEKRIKSQFIEPKQNHKHMKNKNVHILKSEISSRQSVCRPLSKREVSDFIQQFQLEKGKQGSRFPPSNRGRASQNRQQFSQDVSEQSRSQYSSKKSQKEPSQLSQNSKYSQNKSKRPNEKSNKKSQQQSNSSVNSEGSLKNSSRHKDESELGLKSKQSISHGNLDQSDMINSNYNKKLSDKVQKKSQLSSSNGSLKMLSNNSKKLDSRVQNKSPSINLNKQKPQQLSNNSLSSSQLGFQSKVSIKKQTKSVNPSQLQLKKPSSMKQKQVQQQKSIYQLDSSIEVNFKKKSSLKQQHIPSEIKTQQHKIQQTFQVNMKKKPSLQVQKVVSKVQHSQLPKNDQSQLRLSSKHSEKSSVRSQYLQLDSALRLPKSLKLNQQKITHSQNINHTSIKHSMKSQQDLPLNSQSIIANSKKSINSQSQLLAQSNHSLRMNSKISNQVKDSHLSGQKQLQKSKALSNRSHRSSRNQNKVKISLERSDQNKNSLKYGKFLTVAGGTQKKQSNSSGKKQNSQSKLSQANRHKSHTKDQYSTYKVNASQYKSNNSKSDQIEQSIEEFNFIERVDQIIDIEQDLHEKRRKVEEQQSITEQFEDFIAKIQGHLFLLREILQVAISAIQMYSQDSTWVFRSCLLALKKYHLERNKIVDSLNGKKSCFKIAQYQLVEQDLKQFLTHPIIKILSKDIQQCNQLFQSLIQEFIAYLHQHQLSVLNELTSKAFDDRFDLGVLLQEFRTQILGLRDKKAQQNNEQEQFEQETQEVINKRIFKLMETTFLLSQLAGKRIKQFTQEIDYVNDFQQYLEEYWPYFQRIVKTFA